MLKVLIIDDDEKLCEAIKLFNFDKFEIDYITKVTYNDVNKLRESIIENGYSLILFDLEIGMINGFKLFEKLLPLEGIATMFLSGASTTEVRVMSLKSGADDFLMKPIDLLELQVRMEKVLENMQTPNFEYSGNYKIDNNTQQIYLFEKKLDLAPMTAKLLRYLLKNQDRNLTREELMNEVWNYNNEDGNRTVDTNINLLRTETKDSNIVTVRGIGYRYEKTR